ncbi:MAG: type II toxin-antitoxin system HicA family toxin [bacterium]
MLWQSQIYPPERRHPDGRTTTVPNHPGRDLARPLLREILCEIELTPEQLVEELGN